MTLSKPKNPHYPPHSLVTPSRSRCRFVSLSFDIVSTLLLILSLFCRRVSSTRTSALCLSTPSVSRACTPVPLAARTSVFSAQRSSTCRPAGHVSASTLEPLYTYLRALFLPCLRFALALTTPPRCLFQRCYSSCVFCRATACTVCNVKYLRLQECILLTLSRWLCAVLGMQRRWVVEGRRLVRYRWEDRLDWY